jgi:hypothetical protein
MRILSDTGAERHYFYSVNVSIRNRFGLPLKKRRQLSIWMRFILSQKSWSLNWDTKKHYQQPNRWFCQKDLQYTVSLEEAFKCKELFFKMIKSVSEMKMTIFCMIKIKFLQRRVIHTIFFINFRKIWPHIYRTNMSYWCVWVLRSKFGAFGNTEILTNMS